MKTFEFWRDRESGLIFAIALEDGVVAGSCGPVVYEEVDDELLERFAYGAGRAPWIEAHRDQFDLYVRPVPA